VGEGRVEWGSAHAIGPVTMLTLRPKPSPMVIQGHLAKWGGISVLHKVVANDLKNATKFRNIFFLGREGGVVVDVKTVVFATYT
jgi:hypothetical protein